MPSSAPAPLPSAPPAGFAPALFDRLWSIDDVAAFAGVGKRTAWRLMGLPAAPARLHLGTRSVRWNPAAVVSYLLADPAGGTSPAPQRTGTTPDADRVTVVTGGHPAAGRASRWGAAPGPGRAVTGGRGSR